MNSSGFKPFKPKFLAGMIILGLAGFLISFSLSSAFAEKDQVGVNADESAKINLGKTEVTTNSTTQVNASAGNSEEHKGESNGNVQSQENAQSQGNVNSQENSQAEYHENYKSSYERMSADSE